MAIFTDKLWQKLDKTLKCRQGTNDTVNDVLLVLVYIKQLNLSKRKLWVIHTNENKGHLRMLLRLLLWGTVKQAHQHDIIPWIFDKRKWPIFRDTQAARKKKMFCIKCLLHRQKKKKNKIEINAKFSWFCCDLRHIEQHD